MSIVNSILLVGLMVRKEVDGAAAWISIETVYIAFFLNMKILATLLFAFANVSIGI